MSEVEQYRQWHHSPSHVFIAEGTYLVTAGTYHKRAFFNTKRKITYLQNTFFQIADKLCWSLQAWSLFSNHYHFVARAPKGKSNLVEFIRSLHSLSAKFANLEDGTPGRKVWYQYWDTCITNDRSYYARLKYVHNNAVKHGLVEEPTLYPYCSASWFLSHASRSFYQTVMSFDIDRLKLIDDF